MIIIPLYLDCIVELNLAFHCIVIISQLDILF